MAVADAGPECYLIYIELNPAVALHTSTFKLAENGGVELLRVVGAATRVSYLVFGNR